MNLSKENYRMIIIGIAFFLGFVFVFAIYSTIKSLQEKEEQEIAEVSKEFAGYDVNGSTINYISAENLFIITSDHELSNDEKTAVQNSIKDTLGDRYDDFTNESGNLNIEYELEGSVMERPTGTELIPPADEDEYQRNRPKNHDVY